MWNKRTSLGDWNSADGMTPMDRSDFSPVFWLAGSSKGGRERKSGLPMLKVGQAVAATRPFVNYPVLIGLFLLGAYVAERTFLSLM